MQLFCVAPGHYVLKINYYLLHEKHYIRKNMKPSFNYNYYNLCICICIFINLTTTSISHSKQPIVLSDSEKEYIINNYIDFFRDNSQKLTIEKILLQYKNDFISSKHNNILNFGFTDDAIWIKFNLINKNIDIHQWLMEIKYYFLWDIDLYILQDQQIIEHKKSGILTPFKKFDMIYRWHIFDLSLQPEKEYTFYMRFKAYLPMTLPISIKTTKTFVHKSFKEFFIKGFFYGILLFIIIYHIYSFISQKEKNYFYFFIFILTLFFIRFSFDGFTRMIIFSKYHTINVLFTYYFPILIPVLFFYGILFVSSFPMAKKMPIIFKYLFLSLKIIWFSFGLFILFGLFFIIPLFPVCAVITIISFILFFLFLLKKGYSPAYYYIFGWIFLVSGFVSFSLLRLNYINSSLLTESSMETCILGMVLCFQFSFIYQTSLIKKQQQLSQLKLIEKAEENEMLIRKQKEMLEKQVEQRTIELKIAKDKAEQANLDRLNFIASINHDLRTPLNSILGYSQIFKFANKSIQDCQNVFHSIYESAKYLLSLINDLMDLSKIESGSFELIPEIIDLKDLINRVINIIKVLAIQKSILFKTYIDNNLPDGIITDEKRLHQVLINLLGNAVKFTEIGEVSFCVKKIQNKEGLKDSNIATIYFEIKDTGPGIDQNKLKEIFKPYTQVSKEDNKKEGFGLGLSISQSIVKSMGGTIFVDSEPKKGCCFWFQINVPVINEKIKQSSKALKIPITNSDQPKKILIVDDILQNRLVLQEFLNLFGCETMLAEDGHDCIKKAVEIVPDLILMDIQMPKLDGINTLKMIKQIDEIKNIPVVAVSASFTEMKKQTIIHKGFDDYIAKPIVFNELAYIIKKYLNLDAQNVEFDSFTKKSINEINPELKKVSEKIKNNELPLIDIKEVINNLRNDDALIKQILELAIEDIPEYIKTLKHNLYKRQPEEIKMQTHKLKSSFQLISAKRCEAVVNLISQNSNNLEYDLAVINLLESEWDRLVHKVQKILQEKKIHHEK